MYDRVLVPLALDHQSSADVSIEVAKKLLNSGGRITLLNIVEEIPTFAQSYLPEGTLVQTRTVAEEKLASLAEGDDTLTARVVIGKASVTILEVAQAEGTDCIVIASHKPGLEDYFLGSTAARVVRHAKCCVHVMR